MIILNMVNKQAEETNNCIWHRNSWSWNGMYIPGKTKRTTITRENSTQEPSLWAEAGRSKMPLKKTFLNLC
jgi:hypothetical protein